MGPNEKQKLKSKNFAGPLYPHSIKQLQRTTQTFLGQHCLSISSVKLRIIFGKFGRSALGERKRRHKKIVCPVNNAIGDRRSLQYAKS